MAKSAVIIPFPATTRARNAIRRSAHARRIQEAVKAGFIGVNNSERALIQDVLRWMQLPARDAVYAYAVQMQKSYPWRRGVDGQQG